MGVVIAREGHSTLHCVRTADQVEWRGCNESLSGSLVPLHIATGEEGLFTVACATTVQ